MSDDRDATAGHETRRVACGATWASAGLRERIQRNNRARIAGRTRPARGRRSA
jgi:hypothetical protein